MNKDRNFYKNTYYHLYNRGANGADIFFDKESYLDVVNKASKYLIKTYKITARSLEVQKVLDALK